MKNILIIANAFPPYKYIGRLRNLQYSKYLPKYNWRPIVLTPKPSYLWDPDEITIKEIPCHIKVYRAFMPNSPTILLRNLKKMLLPKIKNSKELKHTNLSRKKSDDIYSLNFSIRSIKFVQSFLEKFIYIPGQLILWLPFALTKALKIIKKRNIDIIYTSAPAYSMHIIGYYLKLLTNTPWVADYRDLWTGDLSRTWLPKWRKNLDRTMEAAVLKKTDKIIVVSKQMIPIMKNNFPFLTESSFSVISNGFDSQLLNKNPNTYIKEQNFNIVYTGQLKNFTHSKFFTAVKNLIEDNSEIAEKLKITFVGRIVETENEKIFNNLDRGNFKDTLKFTGWVKHSKALEIQKNSDVLLLLISKNVPNRETILTGKIFEYISTRRPILALAPDGAAKDVIMQTNTGVVVDPEDTESIKNAITDLYKKWKSNQLFLQPNWDEIKKYDRINLTKKLSNILNKLI